MSPGEENRGNAGENGGTFSLQWRRAGHDVIVSGPYYIVRHRTGHGWWFNAWKGDHRDRDLREYVSAGSDVDAVKAACERHSEGK